MFHGGKIIIESGATFNCQVWIRGLGSLQIEGTIWSGTITSEYWSINGSIIVNGIFEMGGVLTDILIPVTINNGGYFHIRNNVHYGHSSIITINLGASFLNEGIILGNGTFVHRFPNSGTVAPGNSPGVITVNGDYTATSSAIHNFAIGGTSSNQYDRLVVSDAADLSGALNVSLINGFTPTTDHDLPIITGTINGTFSSVNIPSTYSLVYTTNSVILRRLTTILPVNFLGLEAKKENSGAKLIWKVQDESNVVRYEIEKSTDGSLFSKIGFVSASKLNQYSYIDPLVNGKSYYRIKSVDADGNYKYSSIVKLDGGKSSVVLKAFPLPAGNKITLQHKVVTRNSKITISSQDGRLIKSIVPDVDTDNTIIDLSGFKAGFYLISFNDGNSTESIKIIKN